MTKGVFTMDYIALDWSEVDFPSAEELYELVDGEYVLSTDEDSVEGKTYYYVDDLEDVEVEAEYFEYEVDSDESPSDLELYEFDGEDYVLTEDVVAVAGKTYYEMLDSDESDIAADELDMDDAFYTLSEDEVTSPVAQGLYEFSDGEYFISEDVEPVPGTVYYASLDPEEFEDISESDENAEDTYIPDSSSETAERDENVEVVDVRAENFMYAYLGYVENPSAEGLYELNDGLYRLSSDESIIPGKLYYEYYAYSDMYEASVSEITDFTASPWKYYEKIDGEYERTVDIEPVEGKTYYRSHTDDLNPYISDPSLNSSDLDDSELPDVGDEEGE